MSGTGSSNGRAVGMNMKVGCCIPPRFETLCDFKLQPFLKNVRSLVENENYHPYTIDILNINFTNEYIYTYPHLDIDAPFSVKVKNENMWIIPIWYQIGIGK